MIYVTNRRPTPIASNLRVVSGSMSRDMIKEIPAPVKRIRQELRKDETKNLFVYIQRKGEDFLSKMKDDWQRFVKPKRLIEPEASEVDVILKFLFGK